MARNKDFEAVKRKEEGNQCESRIFETKNQIADLKEVLNDLKAAKGCVRPLSLFYSDASADGVEEGSLVPRSHLHAWLRRNATMSHAFSCTQASQTVLSDALGRYDIVPGASHFDATESSELQGTLVSAVRILTNIPRLPDVAFAVSPVLWSPSLGQPIDIPIPEWISRRSPRGRGIELRAGTGTRVEKKPGLKLSVGLGLEQRASSRASYGDDAVSYVQLKRDSKCCTVKCKICPEHKVHAKLYGCTLVVDEENEVVLSVQCEDCVASQGGCKHAIAFLMWLHRRSEEPSCTSVECYWKKSKLSESEVA
ncbi:hypothetical protein EVAR_90042_1 [Eumeta japonica]|uniref:SWIM-type domain-containing protein n=1 Tax=Eumeta variegata TaxID=151549 RepID=A0A4C1WTP1_EUMVA|nr:hypothetical protein EVAR_90042_1 [Eumeta japonica]